MKIIAHAFVFALVLAGPLAASAANDATASVAVTNVAKKEHTNKNKYNQYGIMAQVKQYIDADGLSEEELVYFAEALLVSYNEVHNKDRGVYSKVTQATSEPANAVGVVADSALRGKKKWLGYTSYYKMHFGSTCRLCPNDDDMLTDTTAFGNPDLRQAWELALCQELDEGPFVVFDNVEDCHIEVSRFEDTISGVQA